MGLTDVEPVPLKLTVRGAMPVDTDGTLDALTPLAIFGFDSTISVAVLIPAAAGTPNAAESGPFAAFNGPQLDAEGTAKLLSTNVA